MRFVTTSSKIVADVAITAQRISDVIRTLRPGEEVWFTPSVSAVHGAEIAAGKWPKERNINVPFDTLSTSLCFRRPFFANGHLQVEVHDCDRRPNEHSALYFQTASGFRAARLGDGYDLSPGVLMRLGSDDSGVKIQFEYADTTSAAAT
jgi:hypothetical protein